MSLPENIRAIFYDLDGTLRTSVPLGREMFAKQAAALGLSITPDRVRHAAIWEHRYFAESPEIISDREAFQGDSHAFWLNYCLRQLQVLGATPEQARELAPQLNTYMGEHFRPQDIIFEDVYDTLQTLRQRGYFLGIMSNRFEPYHDYLNERGLGELFDLVVHAGQAGIRKPNPEVFHFMLAQTRFSPSESLYVGDNYFADVLGARRAGMLPVLYDRERLFESPDCLVIQKHTQILSLLAGRN